MKNNYLFLSETEIYEKITTDVLIIGGGGAACRAAISASDNGAKTLIALKGKLGFSGATTYKIAVTAGYNAPDGIMNQNDNPNEFYKDIIDVGLGMASKRLARILANETIESKNDLEKWGMRFEKREDGRYLSITGCFSKRPRMHIIKGHGEPIIKTLVEQIKKRDIQIFDSTMIIDLLVKNGKCLGAIGINEETGRIIIFLSKAVVLATGGAGELFKMTLNPTDITGDGYAMAFRAGVKLVNMEFMQAGLGFIHPVKAALMPWLWEAHPLIFNKKKEYFLESYLPNSVNLYKVIREKTNYPFSCINDSKYLEIAIQKEIRKGNVTSNNGIYIDFSKVEDSEIMNSKKYNILSSMWPVTKKWLLDKGIDITKEFAQITTFGHALNGGLLINEEAQTSLNGLFAAGEVAGGPHGADRLGGNMLNNCQVFGKRAGFFAANLFKDKPNIEIKEKLIKNKLSDLLKNMKKKGKINPKILKKELAETMWLNMLVVRSDSTINNATKKIDDINEKFIIDIRIENYKDFIEAIELKNLLTVAKIITSVSKLRKESRGSHYREDYPIKKDEFNKPFIIYKKEGSSKMIVKSEIIP